MSKQSAMQAAEIQVAEIRAAEIRAAEIRAAEIRAAAAQASAEFGAAADEVDEAAAARLGVNQTDLRILGLISAAGTMTAGAVASEARLSPAATTTALQRLVSAGHLTREVDPQDRRRAVVAVTAATRELLDRVYAPIAGAGLRLLGGYSPAELELITRFLRQGLAMQREQAERIRGMAG
ncbi:hypothetical protein ACTI_41730 [Actinoplanes sp. OR16]|uniref:MarR family winged helix-turn-helix transcriptional regulator n=1 Tax=Actinoplanes sp. OR16 TaxID=946334 RepID=UPI000F6CC278|nr:MarR family transcriptional regulator [Actinoplanes sp. OR16]BBH67488.1 hypothetical protein ACTI_41730 [Actinoplanes sp. OR16]